MSKGRINKIMNMTKCSHPEIDEKHTDIFEDTTSREVSPLRVDNYEEFERMYEELNPILDSDADINGTSEKSPQNPSNTDRSVLSDEENQESKIVITTALVHEPTSFNSRTSISKVLADPNMNIAAPLSVTSNFETFSPAVSKISEENNNSPLPSLFFDLENQEPNIRDSDTTPIPSPGNDFEENALESLEPDTSFAETPPTKKRMISRKNNPGKKRIADESKWKDVQRKKLLNSGKAYRTRKGQEREERTLKAACDCRLKCFSKFSEDDRTEIFQKFWKIGDHGRQWEFIAKMVEKKPKKRYTKEESSRREFTCYYNLPKGPEKELVAVCQKMFLNTFSIGKDVVYTAINKQKDCTDYTLTDLRGKHGCQKILITPEMIKSVCDHVEQFAPVESHYVRKTSNRKYLDADLTFEKMFKMYKDWCTSNEIENPAQTLRQYRDIVNAQMNIGFFKPKKDQCDVCQQYKNLEIPTEEQKLHQSQHLQNKELARKLKNRDKEESNENPQVLTATFDFQKVLTCPYGEISIFYYKRKLNLYNFTIYVLASHEGVCFMWHEVTAKRGANEVASCLFKFIKYYSEKGVKEFRFWSDNCTGQNRNRIVYSMYLYAAQKFNVKITHSFLEKGHTQNEGDSVHALIERNAKGRNIYSPDEWFALVKFAKVCQPFYRVIEVSQDDILDFKALLVLRNWNKTTEGDRVSWNSIKEISVDPSNDELRFKYDFSETEFHILQHNTVATRRGRQRNMPVLTKAHERPIPLQKAKHKDLQELCTKNLIPAKYHNFYKSLPTAEDVNDASSSDGG